MNHDPMFVDNKGIISAILACLAVAAIIAFALLPSHPVLSGNLGYQEQPGSYRPGNADCQLAANAGLDKTKSLPFTLACQEAQEEHRLKANDLLQQKRAADAAETMAVASFEQTRINAWAEVFGFITLSAAIAAAFYAREAARHTQLGANEAKRSANAAEEGLIHTKFASSATIRPWIAIKSPQNGRAYNSMFNGVSADEAIIFHCLIKNESSFPAINCSIYSDFTTMKPGDPVPNFVCPEVVVSNILASGETLSTGFMPVFGENLVQFRARQLVVIVWVNVRYKGTFGDQQESWETEACFEVSHKGGTMAAGGNEGEAILCRPIGQQNRVN